MCFFLIRKPPTAFALTSPGQSIFLASSSKFPLYPPLHPSALPQPPLLLHRLAPNLRSTDKTDPISWNPSSPTPKPESSPHSAANASSAKATLRTNETQMQALTLDQHLQHPPTAMRTLYFLVIKPKSKPSVIQQLEPPAFKSRCPSPSSAFRSVPNILWKRSTTASIRISFYGSQCKCPMIPVGQEVRPASTLC